MLSVRTSRLTTALRRDTRMLSAPAKRVGRATGGVASTSSTAPKPHMADTSRPFSTFRRCQFHRLAPATRVGRAAGGVASTSLPPHDRTWQIRHVPSPPFAGADTILVSQAPSGAEMQRSQIASLRLNTRRAPRGLSRSQMTTPEICRSFNRRRYGQAPTVEISPNADVSPPHPRSPAADTAGGPAH